MQFSVIAILAAVASAASNVTTTIESSTLVTVTSCGPSVSDCPAAHSTMTKVDTHSTLVTITSCGPSVTDCPAAHKNMTSSATSSATVSTYHGAANKQYAAGAVALAAGALLAL